MRWIFAALAGAGCAKATGPVPAATDATRTVVVPLAAGPTAEQLDKALAAMARGDDGDLERAIEILEPLAAADATMTAAYDLGIAYLRRGWLDQAESQFQRVTVARPEDGDAWLGLGTALDRQGEHAEALAAFENGVRRAPEHGDLRVALVSALRRAGRTEAALAAAKEALPFNAKSMQLYNEFGLAYLEAGDLVMARFVFQKAIQEIPGAEQDATLQTNLGWTYYLDDDKALATEHLRRALELDPELVPAMIYLARVHMDDHNYADTVPLLERAAALEPTNGDVQLTLGVAYRGVERLDDAKRAYERALELDPSNPSGHFNLGILLGDYQKDYDAGVAALRRYVDLGGAERERAVAYIDALNNEKEIARKREEAEAQREARDAEREREAALAAEAAAAEAASAAPPEAAAPEPEPEPRADQ